MWHTNWPFTPLHFVNGAMYFGGREGTAFSHCASCQCCWSLLFHAANNKACVRNAENPQITLTQVAQSVLTVYIFFKSKLQQPGVKTASLLCLEWSSCWNCIPVHLPKNNICTDTIYWFKKYQLTDLLLLISLGWRHLDTETTECQYNFTSFIWGSESRYMDNYYVSVVAVEGGERSEEVLSQTFSFNRVKPVDVMCKKTPSSGSLTDTHTHTLQQRLWEACVFVPSTGFLDFPPVDVNQKDSGVLVSFANPVRFNLGTFSFSISSNSVSDSNMSGF